MRRLTIPKITGPGIGASAMNHERIIWWIVLGPLCALLILTMIVGAGPVSAAFEAVFEGIAWVVAVWLVLLGLV